MRKLAMIMALASTALATPALARDKAWYVGVEGGAMIVEDIDWSVVGAGTNASTRSGTATVDHDYGWDVDGVVGYDFGAFRLETEAGYRRASIDSLRTTAGVPLSGSTQANPGTYDGVGGRTSALSFMVNGLLDFGEDDGLQGFVGGGAGVARVQARASAPNAYRFLDDSDTVFAWQALAGIRAPLSENVDVSLKYRFFNADNVKLFDARGSSYDGRFRSHSLLGGVTYNFGAPEEAAPPPPPPPP
ncbi:outer membrane protein, partial [Sphingomonas sp. 8AM]|uniref:outer membrane protein n=1 Tax=Sphingomonas sp. 8AM TaxID=2653170 RepID=UPI001358D253